MIVILFTKKIEMILCSIRTFWYKGSAENKEKGQVIKKDCIPQRQQRGLEGLFLEKVAIGSLVYNIV